MDTVLLDPWCYSGQQKLPYDRKLQTWVNFSHEAEREREREREERERERERE
jgi:hypothetical protein